MAVECIYKPVRGERPLWDFPDGTLAERELAAYLVSRGGRLGLRPADDHPGRSAGPGMVQRWIGDCDPDLMVDLVPVRQVPAGWLPVMRAIDAEVDVAVVHADNPQLAVPGRVRPGRQQRRPQGLARAADPGRPGAGGRPRAVLPSGRAAHDPVGLGRHPAAGSRAGGLGPARGRLDAALGDQLDELITTTEMAALRRRIDQLRATKKYPKPPGHLPRSRGRRCEHPGERAMSVVTNLGRTAARAVGRLPWTPRTGC